MNAAIYARVSSKRQAKDQTIEQQVERLRAYAREQGWTLEDSHIYRDDGYSGASLSRPGLDALRDHAAEALIEVVLITAPDRLARKYLHQVLLLEELAGCGCRVVFADRPMSSDPNDQLLLQIRGAVAEYERSLITERMRRAAWSSCGQVSSSPGPVATTATASIRIIRAIPAGSGSTTTRGRSSARSSPGTWRRARPSTRSRRGSRRRRSRRPAGVATGRAATSGTSCGIRPTSGQPMGI